MKFEKKVSLKFAIVLVLMAILVSSTIVYTFAVSPSSTFTISPGIYPGAPSYTVWREGSNYFAKDANGFIAYSGTNAAAIIQNAIDAGNYVLITGGIYEISTTIFITKPFRWISGVGNNQTTLCARSNMGSMLNVSAMSVKISNLHLCGNNKTADGIFLNGYAPIYGVLHFEIDHNLIESFFGHSIYLLGEPADGKIHDNIICQNKYSLIIAASSDNEIYDNEIGATSNDHCLGLSGSAHNIIHNNFIYMAGYNWVTKDYTAAHSGIMLNGAHYEELHGNRVSFNGGGGISIYNSTYCTIVGGYIYANNKALDDRSAIDINSDSNHNLISSINMADYNLTNIYLPEFGYLEPVQAYGIHEYVYEGTPDWNTIIGVNAWNATISGIAVCGAHTQVHLCYNLTEWID